MILVRRALRHGSLLDSTGSTFDVMAMIMVGLTISFMPAAESALCLSNTVAINVTSAADVHNLTDVLACAGRGAFDISWYPSATISQTIEISNMKEVTITGVGVPRVRGALADNNGAGAVVNTEFGSGTGTFSVSNGSTLRLNHLVLEGGNAEHGGAVSLQSSSSLFVLSCAFANNIAENGDCFRTSLNSVATSLCLLPGAIYASSSAIYITGNTSFDDNSALLGGALYASDSSSVYVDGDISFSSNFATSDGGAVYLSDNSSITVDGSITFLANTADGFGGALYASDSSSIDVHGNAVFENNLSKYDGGAVLLFNNSSIRVDGSTSFVDNTAEQYGGALHASWGSYIGVDGNSTFDNNYSDDGGAIYATVFCSVTINGNSSFRNNLAVFNGGAMCASYGTSVGVGGNITFAHNEALVNGGAIYTFYGVSINIDGITSFFENTADDVGGAMAAYSNVSIHINGNASFVENLAKERGGALFSSETCSVKLDGNNVFYNNTAWNDGGAICMYGTSSIYLSGSNSILNNSAGSTGGALSATSESSIYVRGDTNIWNNSANNGGEDCTEEPSHGAAFIILDSVLNIDGNTSLQNNAARNSGGVIYSSESEIVIDGHTSATYNTAVSAAGVILGAESLIRIDGHTSITHNTAYSPGGGALHASQSEINIAGNTYIAHNVGYDGGAILAEALKIDITGNATFAYNSAIRDGGAFKMVDTSLTIGTNTHEGGDFSTSDLFGDTATSAQEFIHEELAGVLTSTQQSNPDFTEAVSFIKNTAPGYGGAISLVDPVELNISAVAFTLNEAGFGGAVALTSTALTPVDIRSCQFEYNSATNGGALYLSGEGQTSLRGSLFRYNVAEEKGGALLNSGEIEIQNTEFAENTATDGGLAVQHLESPMLLWNVTFKDNILSCPSQTYSYTQHASPDSCRFEVACSQCLDGCDSNLSSVNIERTMLPTCEPIPAGVRSSSTAIVLQTFDVRKGYYRVSGESPIVLECYQREACIGGTNASNYCAVGYQGPYCAVCTEGYASGSSSRCFKCSGENKALAVGLSTAMLVLVMFVVWLVVSDLLLVKSGGTDETPSEPRRWWQEKQSNLREMLVKAIPMSAIRIVVVVLQIVVQFTEIAGAIYPEEYEAFLSTMSFVNFDIGSIMSSSCLFTTDFYDRLLLSTAAPLAILLACSGSFFVAKARNRNSTTARAIVKHKHLSVGLFIVFFVYSSVSFTVFQTFACDPLDDGNAYLRADYSISCYTETHMAYLVYASVMVCVYPVGIPAFFAWWLVRNRQELDKPGRETAPQLKSYRCLWAPYKPSSYYYEVVECGRRIALTGAAVFVLPNSAEQIAIVLFLAVVFMFVSESISPFVSKSDMWLYRWGNGIILASMYVALLLKADLAGEESRSSWAITALLIAANVFMIFTVAVQAVLLMREICVSKENKQVPVTEFPLSRRTGQSPVNRPTDLARASVASLVWHGQTRTVPTDDDTT